MTGGAVTGDPLHALLADPAPRLMIPGPCQPAPEVVAAFHRPTVAHYGPLWAPLHEHALHLVGRVLDAHRTYLLPGSGTLAVEACVANLFGPGQVVVVPESGYFGTRLVEIAHAHGLRVRTVPVTVGEPVEPARVAAQLDGADGVLMTHVETATGVRHPVEEVAREVRRRGGLLVVDAVSSVGGEALAVEATGIDAVAAGSQKGLGCPPGLAVIGLSARGQARLRRRTPVPWYLDLTRWDRERTEGADWEPHPVTMPSNLVAALVVSLRSILATGTAAWWAERARVAAHCRRRLAELGMWSVPGPGSAANLVVVAHCTDPVGTRRWVLREAGIAITGGLAPLTDVIRIGLVGANGTTDMVDALADTLAARRGSAGAGG